MSHNFLLSASFHNNLLNIDQETAQLACAKGCTHCGGNLHQANYPRIGFGVHRNLSQFYSTRYSFCCSLCRRRTTPASIRFFGQRRYVATLFVLLSALRLSPTEQHREQLVRRLGLNLSLSTWKRWRAWWRNDFLHSQFWNNAKSYVLFTDTASMLPKVLLRCFSIEQSFQERIILFLQFLSPLHCQSI